MQSEPNLDTILSTYWGHSSFRPQQREIIRQVLQGKDAFALLPTGGGKSVCYQLPALVMEGITLVISPLIALMQDQVAQLKAKNIKALALTSGLRKSELDTRLDNCIHGNYKLLYLSPERLEQELVIQRIKHMNISLIAVDEAHCISQWGNDFRPAYRKLAQLRALKPEVPCLALTATATPWVVDDILEQLEIDKNALFKTSFARPNLSYTVRPLEQKQEKLLEILKRFSGPSIVYVRNRKATQEVTAFLENRGLAAAYYHGGVSNDQRLKRFEQWKNDHIQVMVATTAFGMGIDKANVKTVVHMELPESLESYFQEAGRAGRDGQRAYAVTLLNTQDEIRLRNQFEKGLPEVAFVKKVLKKLYSYFQIAYGEQPEEGLRFDFNDFRKAYDLPGQKTYNALLLLDRHGVLVLSQEFQKKTQVHFGYSHHQLQFYLVRHPQYQTVTEAILRMYTGLFDQVTSIQLEAISIKAGLSQDEVHQTLLELEKDEVLQYDYQQFDTQIQFLVPREDDRTVNVIAKSIKAQNALKKRQIQDVIDYMKNDHLCRSVQLLSYFGEKQQQPCGICDVCRDQQWFKAHKNAFAKAEQDIKQLLAQQSLTSGELEQQLSVPLRLLLEVLDDLLKEEEIELISPNTYRKKT
ncbi:RecQ family ATP-dependent DNA helicase [Croceiramulus getboli]|nr:RecQ family ATP-dependent DNA helicase [Flavobacteriaceae bacterium YJPT1-3]